MDSQGAVISDAAVQLTNPATGQALNAKSSKEGEFSFPELTVGIYRLTVSLSGFQTKKIDNINVEVSKVQNIKVELSVGAESTSSKSQPMRFRPIPPPARWSPSSIPSRCRRCR